MSVVAHRVVWRAACCFLLLAHVAFAKLTNRTIDDENGDSVTGLQPVYAPASGAWNYGPTCSGCYVQPDVDDCFDHSWHDVTASPTDPEPRNITLTFNGTAIWVFGVVPNNVLYATTFVNISFELDGHTVGTFSHLPSGVVGGVAALLIALLAILCWRRRHGRGSADRIRSMRPFEAHDDAIEPKPEAHSSDLSISRSMLPTQYTLRSAAAPSGHPLSTAAALSHATSSFAATNTPSIPTTASSAELSSTVLTAGTTSARSPRGPRGQSKAAMRREELSRQMRDIEAHVADLRRRQSQQSAPSSASLYSQSRTGIGRPPPVPVVERYDDSDLRRQIETLQTEVERLRLEAITHEEPPPAYEEPEEDGPLVEHEEGTSRAD
ncbi:hypothetical protein POSPLADRAFT_1139596 [Postia placenta MAD-698-R-SB12]|uniref:Uncharacterized protein n=1 Tax=Postia placenta MAD-698-R-SB12 TaxID=670580 RepID=A0A1X6N4Z7_9APHY|nr:hypothetical protein POSPLADRAFT_1139596 [Postia placenta MAD-698-R-SB12]OSX63600.1 hypothetical protein POSPLADRAFT_1139596 [Postia placenta MAD-698-R-SB12]